MHRQPSRTLALIAFLAVMCAQVFGMSKGYVCVCHGDAVVTEARHCHAPHHATPHESEKPCTQNDCPDTEHKPQKEQLQAASMTKAPEAPAPLLAVLPESFITEMISLPWALPVADFEHTVLSNASPPASLVVARCMVMLV